MTDSRAALEAIGQMADIEIDIANAALQLARIDAPAADWSAAGQHLSAIARRMVEVSGAITKGNVKARAAALSEVLVGEFGYAGDTNSYDDLANANLISVIERRRGLPVALGIIWLHAARAAGWECHGVDFPAHFLIALDGKTSPTVLDVFHGGGIVTGAALQALLQQVEGEGSELRPGLLKPMSTRRVLLRLQNNILTRRLTAHDWRGGLRCAEDMALIAPDHADLWRQAGVLNQKLEQIGAAKTCYERFLALVPEGAVADRVRAQLEILDSGLH